MRRAARPVILIASAVLLLAMHSAGTGRVGDAPRAHPALSSAYAAMREAFLAIGKEDQETVLELRRQDIGDAEMRRNNNDKFNNGVGPVDLYSCGGTFFAADDDPHPGLSDVASDMASFELRLSDAGYGEVSRKELQPFEEAMVQAYSAAGSRESFWTLYEQERDRFARGLVDRLNSRSGAGQRQLVYEGECGAGEARFTIETQPSGATLHLISRWGALVCEGLKIDPYDIERCKGWRPVGAPSIEQVVGDYHYLATWANGRSSRGRLRFSDDAAEPLVIITPNGPSYR